MTDLSIIIVNWNGSQLMQRCLQAIDSTVGDLDHEVIVIDNASTDDSIDVIRQGFPHVSLIENQANVGFARANNQGIQVAKGRYYLLLNSDTFVHEATLRDLVRFMEEHPQSGAAGCRLYYEDGKVQRSCTSFPTLATELWQALWLDRIFSNHPVFGRYLMTYWNLDDEREVDSIMGACMLLRRDAIEEIGMLDEGYFMYSEEVDLCYRLKQAGWKVYFTPQVTATHLWGGSSKQVPNVTTFLRLYESRIRFFRKHYGKLSAILLKMILFVGSTMRVVGGYVAYQFHKKQKLIKSSYNYWRLLRSLRTF